MDTQINNDIIKREPTLGPIDETLRQTVQGFKLVGLKCNKVEIALISGISKSSLHHNKNQMIDEFWSNDSLTPDDDKKFILDKSIAIAITQFAGESKTFCENMLGVILGTYLKVETDLLNKAESLKKVWTIGLHIANIHSLICSYKNKDDGVPVHSTDNPNAEYLLQTKNMSKLNLNKLFSRSSGYLPDKYAKKWLSTELLIKYVGISSDKLLDMISYYNICGSPSSSLPYPFPHMLRQKSATQKVVEDTANNTDLPPENYTIFKVSKYC